MKIFNKNLNKKKPPLNFQSLLIISYGRSGSTLLQGVLNSIEGVVIRGENYNTCFHLFEAYQAILNSKKQTGKSPQNSFYGAELLNADYFLSQMEETVKNLLLPDYKNDDSIRCFGFKEIRYWYKLKSLPEFLDFLKKIFPNCCFIFNTRNNEDVINSWVNLNWRSKEEDEQMQEMLNKMEDSFLDYSKANEVNCFHITYEDVIGKREKLEQLYSFLGAKYESEKIDAVLKVRHSYKPNQKHIAELADKSSKISRMLKIFHKNSKL